MKARRRRRSEAGFTLVEAMVSLFVFSLIAAGCAAMLMQSVGSQKAISAAHESLRELQTTRALLAADLLQAAPRAVRRPGVARLPDFVGGHEDIAMAFTRAGAEPDPDTGAQTSLLYVEYAVQNGALVRRTRHHPDAVAGAETPARVLMHDVSNVKFSFYDGATWGEGWAGAGYGAALPRAVAVELDTKRYGRVRLETLVGLGR